MQTQTTIQKVIFIKVVDVYKEDSGWFVARTEEGEKVVGESIVEPSGELKVDGYYDTHTRFGKQFKITRIHYENLLNIIEILLTSGFLNGIKKSKTKEMMTTLGERVFEVLDAAVEEPPQFILWNGKDQDARDVLMTVKGVGQIVATQIIDSWKSRRGIAGVAVLSIRAGLSAKQFRKCLAEMGPMNLTDAILRDPYSLTNVEGITWETADAIAVLEWEGKRKIPHDSPERAAAAIREIIRINSLQGHTCLDYHLAISQAEGLAKIKDIEPLLDLQKSGLMIVGNMVTTLRWHKIEKRAADHIKLLLQAKFPQSIDFATLQLGDFTDYQLGDEQMAAVDMALRNNVSIITGAPGTGKTTAVLITLLNILDKFNISYSLCAPTGKAKTRIQEATGRMAYTLHMMFGIGSDHMDIEPLCTNYLFVDESSMISMDMMDDLLVAIRPGQRVVFIGDGDQLPPVGPGEPLLQMLEAGVPQVRLKQVHRQALKSGIIRAAHEILAGNTQLTQAPDFIIATDREDNIPARTVKAINWLMETHGLAFTDIQVLTPINKGPCGRGGLNKYLQDIYNPGAPVIASIPFRIYDPVIQIKNNYDKNIMNGEVGSIISMDVAQQAGTDNLDIPNDSGFVTSQTNVMEVDYPMHTDTVGYSKDDFDQLQLAYAITIHKSQGSQFPAVIVIMPYTFEGFYLRQLPYTAITRAEQFCIVITAPGAIAKYIANDKRLRRNSLFSVFLKEVDNAA